MQSPSRGETDELFALHGIANNAMVELSDAESKFKAARNRFESELMRLRIKYQAPESHVLDYVSCAWRPMQGNQQG